MKLTVEYVKKTNPQLPILVLRYDESDNISGNYVCRTIGVRRIYCFWPFLHRLT